MTPPPKIPDHELLRCIGSGSYGDVWLARSVTGQWRAVKIVHRSRFDRDKPYDREFNGIQKFEPVSRTDASQVNILHVGRDDDAGFFFYVMDLADDERTGREIEPEMYSPKTLRSELAARQRLPFAETLDIALALTTALEHLHDAGLVHRDVKPSNIVFIGGVPKLADIGLVTDSASTRSFVGTAGYLPPEGPGSPSADLFALGKVLYEAAFGLDRLDFPAMPPGFADFPDAAQLLELNEILLKACATDARERYRNAAQMRVELELLRRGQSVVKQRNRQHNLKLLWQCLVLAPFIFGAAFGVNWLIKERPGRNAPQAAAVPAPLPEITQLLEQDNAALALAKLTRQLRQSPTDAAAAYALVDILECRNFPLALAACQTFSAAHQLRFSPDGAWLLTPGPQGTGALHEARTGKVRHELKGAYDAYAVAFSPDGRQVVAWGNAGKALRVFDTASGATLFPEIKTPHEVRFLEFNADGTRLLASGPRYAQLWDTATGQAVGPARTNPPIQFQAKFSPDGTEFLMAGLNGHLQTFSSATGETNRPLKPWGGIWTDAAIAPDNHRFAAGSTGGFTLIADGLGVLRQTKRVTFQPGLVRRVTFSPDGGRVVTLTPTGVLVADSFTGDPLGPLISGGAHLREVTISPDSFALLTAFQERQARLWDAFTCGPLMEPLHHREALTTGELSRDGRLAATSCQDRQVVVWDVRPGAALSTNGGPWRPAMPPLPVPELILTLAEAVGSQRYDANGIQEFVPVRPVSEWRERIDTSNLPPFWRDWAAWFLADRETRPAHPGARLTVTEVAGRLGARENFASLIQALRLAPENARLWARLASYLRRTSPPENRRNAAEAAFAASRARQLAPNDPEIARILDAPGQ